MWLAELRAEEGRDHVAVGIGDHRHHDQPGGDVLHVAEAVHLPDAPADEAPEDHEVERRGHGRRHQRLAPDADDAAVLAAHDGLEADAADAVGAGRALPPQLALRRACRPCAALRSTRRMNSSSSRFTLLRMLTTSMPCADSARKDVVHALFFLELDFERMVVDQLHAVARRAAARRAARANSARRSPV